MKEFKRFFRWETLIFVVFFNILNYLIFSALVDNVEVQVHNSTENLLKSLKYLQWVFTAFVTILSFYLGGILGVYHGIYDNARLPRSTVEKNDDLIQKASEAMQNSSLTLQDSIKTQQKSNHILQKLPLIQDLLLTNQKIYNNSEGLLGLISNPIDAPLINYNNYKECIGSIDVIMTDEFLFQDLLLCKTYMRFLVLRAQKITDDFKIRLIVADKKDVYLNNSVSPIFSIYIQLTEALGYENYIIDKKTFQETLEIVQKTKSNGYNREIIMALGMQPSITIGLGEKRTPGNKDKEISEFKMRCDYQNLSGTKQIESLEKQEEAILAYNFLMGFIRNDLINQLKANDLKLDKAFKGIAQNKRKIIKKIQVLNKK